MTQALLHPKTQQFVHLNKIVGWVRRYLIEIITISVDIRRNPPLT